ncbi:MAG: hypothetical protein FWG39_00710 [Alphaproteobacteria bacterium]|nr:hypothetical protein [Alphaproteobacteria bacterium]
MDNGLLKVNFPKNKIVTETPYNFSQENIETRITSILGEIFRDGNYIINQGNLEPQGSDVNWRIGTMDIDGELDIKVSDVLKKTFYIHVDYRYNHWNNITGLCGSSDDNVPQTVEITLSGMKKCNKCKKKICNACREPLPVALHLFIKDYAVNGK